MQILGHSMLAQTIGAYCTLAEIMLVLPIGSVENERQFSNMNFMYARRNGLKEQHLNACCRVRRCPYNQKNFPVHRTYDIWASAKTRCSVLE